MPIRGGRLVDWLRLMRLPSVFTALADVATGHLFMWHSLQPWLVFTTLALASGCIYIGGMVLNDVMDVDQDARERPHRPIPAGRIDRKTAATAACLLLSAGLLWGWLSPVAGGSVRSGVVAMVLVGLVAGYNVLWKSTWLGPLVMGACRGTNLYLGMSSATFTDGSMSAWDDASVVLVTGYALFVMGVTWFARTEAVTSARRTLLWGCGWMLSGLALLSAFPFVGSFAAGDRQVTWSSPVTVALPAVPDWLTDRTALHPGNRATDSDSGAAGSARGDSVVRDH